MNEVNRTTRTRDSPALHANESTARSMVPQANTDELEQGPRAAIIGFTATFSRHDQQALDTVFDEIVYHQDVWDMLQAGWLAPARFTTVKAHMDLADVGVNEGTGDFVKKRLSGKVNQPEVNELVVRTWLDRAGKSSKRMFGIKDLGTRTKKGRLAHSSVPHLSLRYAFDHSWTQIHIGILRRSNPRRSSY